MTLKFFLPMLPPTATAQEHKLNARGKRPRVYDPPAVREARAKLESHLAAHAPQEPFAGAVRLVVKWLFPAEGRHPDGSYKTSRPDTDNLEKALKDEMTRLGFWRDDAQVASEIVEKFYAGIPGIYIEVHAL